jgi:hypothetical protein
MNITTKGNTMSTPTIPPGPSSSTVIISTMNTKMKKKRIVKDIPVGLNVPLFQ